MLLLLLFCVLAGSARARLDEWVRTRLESRLAEVLDSDVSIGSLRLTLTRLAVDLRGVRVVARGPDAPLELLEVDSARLRLRLGTLTAVPAGWLHLAEVTLSGPRCRLRGPLADRPGRDELGRSLDVVIDRLADRADSAGIRLEVGPPAGGVPRRVGPGHRHGFLGYRLG